MAKESLANKMARKAFYRNDVQQSWKGHMQAFGPILKPAFADNFQAKIHLTAALNHISKGNLQQAMPKLQLVQNFVENDADKAMLLFALGVYCETAGAQAEMAAYYTAANQCGHSFYLPYLKVAKYCLGTADYAPAEENFRKAISCFDAAALSDGDKIILGSAYANLGSCLTMLHRYEDAWTALENSKIFCPDAPGRAAAEAVLHALKGDEAQVSACIAALESHAPEAVESVRQSTAKILAKNDPLFFTVPVDAEKMAAFWAWFGTYENELKGLLDGEKYDEGLTPVAKELLAAFPFLENIPNVGLGKNDKGYVLELKDYYAVGIVDAYEQLIAACPEEIKTRWQFAIAH